MHARNKLTIRANPVEKLLEYGIQLPPDIFGYDGSGLEAGVHRIVLASTAPPSLGFPPSASVDQLVIIRFYLLVFG
jgi:hypothetical protein